MFSAVPMMRLSAIVLDRDERPVLQGLGRMGVLHITRAKAGPETAPFAPPDHSGQHARCDRITGRIAELRRLLGIAAPAAARPEPESMTLDRIEELLGQFEQAAAGLAGRRQGAQARKNQVAAVLEQVSSFQGVNIPLEELGRFSFLHFAVGSLPEQQLESLRGKVGGNVILLPLPPKSDRRAMVAVTSHAGRSALEAALRESMFRHETIPLDNGGTVATVMAESGREQERLDAELEQVGRAFLELAASAAPRLAEMEQLVLMEQRILEAEEGFPHTDATVLIIGWVPASDLPAVKQRLKEITRGSCVVEAVAPDHLPEDQVPVLLRHPRILRPFEMLVSGYGLPGYRELEPTLFVAITYMLMFGMMFGDVGHGAVLALAGLAAAAAGRTRKVRDVGVLLLLAGLSSMAFGAVYGSYFGIASLRVHALWHDPLEGNPMDLMLAAMGLGVVIISIGIVLNVINRFRKRDWIGGLLDSFGVVGALFYWGALGLILKYAALRERGLAGLAVTLVVAVPIAAWALREPLKLALARRAGRPARAGGFFEAAMESVVEAFEAALSYMANTISFVRLAAYAMSHAAVLMATFLLAAEVSKFSKGGGALSVLIIIAGNLVAILLEGVIAAVQALRLEYYEFFGKFFSGSGQAFTPFHLGPKKD